MTAYTLAARKTVREIRESLSHQEPTLIDLRCQCLDALRNASPRSGEQFDWESIELWSRLAADLAGLIQQKEKAL